MSNSCDGTTKQVVIQKIEFVEMFMLCCAVLWYVPPGIIQKNATL
jgi:hypothetical protein